MAHARARAIAAAWAGGAFLLLQLVLGGPVAAAPNELPAAVTHAGHLVPAAALPREVAPAVDRARVAVEDREREAAGLAPRFAMPHRVDLTPRNSGLWEEPESGTAVWRLRIAAPGATSLNLGFSRYVMPPGGRLLVYSADLTRVLRPFGPQDNAAHGELWTPVLPADEIVIEVTLPAAAREALELKLASINVGYRAFGELPLSGSCNVDVVCPEGTPWRAEISSVGVISTGGSLFCTGFMVNNTARDRRPYFMTARHCGITSSNAASLVVYWNYQASTCGGPRDGLLNQWQSGSFFRASYTASDFTLVELDQDPDPLWGVTFAGWDRTGVDASSAVTIHHPSADEKAISFEYQPTSTTTYLGASSPGDGTHVRITDWDLGTTEPGSSGSPLFDPQHRVIGQLHGGYAACGNDSSDWYGKFSVSWNGGGTSSTRLASWLDPAGSGATTLDTLSGCDADGVCEAGEDCHGCPSDCISQQEVAACGDGVCHTGAGEDCTTCPADCNSQTGGPSGSRYCCGLDVTCADSRCSASGNTCHDTLAWVYCCGDAVCEGAESTASCAIDCPAEPGCGDTLCDAGIGENPCSCPEDCGAPPADETGAACLDGRDNDCDGPTDCADSACASGAAPDADGDGTSACQDCDDASSSVWASPGEVRDLAAGPGGTLSWAPPANPGAASWSYDLVRSTDPSNLLAAECIASDLGLTSAYDPSVPAPGALLAYLVRAVNGCPSNGLGPLGDTSTGTPRTAVPCQ